MLEFRRWEGREKERREGGKGRERCPTCGNACTAILAVDSVWSLILLKTE